MSKPNPIKTKAEKDTAKLLKLLGPGWAPCGDGWHTTVRSSCGRLEVRKDGRDYRATLGDGPDDRSYRQSYVGYGPTPAAAIEDVMRMTKRVIAGLQQRLLGLPING
jgi:hypothetical protein